MEVNEGDFLKSILNVGDFTRQFKCHYYIINAGNSRPILENWNVYGLRCNGKFFFYTDLSYCKKTSVIFWNALVIFHNPFHCRYEKFIIFIIVQFLLHCPPYSVFLCVCKVNFEEVFLYFMMLNPWLVPLVMTIWNLLRKSEINYSAVMKVCWKESTFQ